jgi:DNA adenine methylase
MAKIKKNKLVAPFVKWVGGKRQLIPEIINNLPNDIKNLKYFEPFIGGGAILFHLQPKSAVINDYNDELINVYLMVKNHLEELIIDLKKHENNSDYFYKIRGIDRTDEFKKLTSIQRASRVIFLNKTCYNGLYRVNSAGEFNTPFGRYKNPNIVNEPTLKAVSKYLNNNDISINCGDYSEILKLADRKSFVYLDPPYHPISESSNFTGYVQGGWNLNDQIRLRDTCDFLNERGIRFLLSNSSSQEIKKIYNDYRIITVKANRAINSNSAKRGDIDEVLIKNYE